MSQDVTIRLITSGSGHTSSTTYTATANLGTISPGTATNAELVAGKIFTLDSDSATSITITPSNGACNGSVPATHTWSVAASPTPTPSTSAGVTPTPTITPTPTPSTSVGGPTWYSFQASEANGDPGSVCSMPTTTTYYNLTASYATGDAGQKLYNSENLLDPNTDTGYIKSGSKYISIGAGTLASFQPECSAISETLQIFYRSAPAGGETAPGELCNSSYNITSPTWAYLPSSFNTATIQAGNKTIYSSTGSAGNTDPSNFTKLATTIVGSGTLTRYWAISTTSGGTTDDGTNWPTIQVTNTDVNSYASSAATLDCSVESGEGAIP